jgi:two-component system sensor histidine kinase/response regulator
MTAEAGASRQKRLLLVDDDPANLSLLQARLEPLGHDISVAINGEAAIAALDAELPDLVLLDFVMPGIGGLGVLGHLRALEHGRHVPVILITAHSERSHRLRGLRAGADEFLEKPIDGPILLARVTTLLSLKESRDALQASRDSLAARNSLLEHLQREQRELTQFIVHDLKNQLSVVGLSLHIAQQRCAEKDWTDLAEVLQEGSGGEARLLSMVEDLLAVSRLEDSTFTVRSQHLSMESLLQSVIATYEPAARHRCVSLIPPANTDWKVWGDQALLRRVLENILENCLRYTPPTGRIAVSARSGSDIEITICNDGPPIPLEERECIFEKFVRGRSEPPVVGSAGLGLYFCKRAIEAHGGRIHVRQTAEWPTSFVIRLPHAQVDSAHVS